MFSEDNDVCFLRPYSLCMHTYAFKIVCLTCNYMYNFDQLNQRLHLSNVGKTYFTTCSKSLTREINEGFLSILNNLKSFKQYFLMKSGL